jgi:hypothetical protein
MPTDETRELGSDIDENQVYLISSETLKKLLAKIKANRPIKGTGIKTRETGQGTFIDSG